LNITGALEIKRLVFNKYAPYYQEKILFNIEEGDLDLSTNYQYSKKDKDTITKLSGLSISLKTLKLRKRDEQESFVDIPSLTVQNTGIDLYQKEFSVGDFSTQKGTLLIRRLKDGKLNLQSLFPEHAKKEQKQEKQEERQPQEKTEQAGKSWLVKVGKVSVDDYTIRTVDLTPAEPVTLMVDEFRLRANNLSTAEGQKGSAALSLRFNQKGNISMEGGIGITPVSADLKVSLKNIELKPLQSYFTDKIKVTVTEGALSTSGNMVLGYSDQKELRTTYSGEAALNNLSTIDKQDAQDVLKMESLAFNDLRFDSNPFALDVKGIALSNFYARLLMHPDGTFNLQQILGGGGGKKEAPAKKEPPLPPPEKKAEEPPRNIKIGSVTLHEGRIDFSDQSVTPEFSLKLTEMGGRVSGLSSEESTLADMELRTKLNDYAPLEITGKVNPLKKDLFVDLKVRFKDMDLSPATPYSGKYVGYTIEKGKLSFDLSYLIDKRKLDSKNVIFLDQFNLGDRVESPHATKLPVKLAIALLKDRSGQIKLDIPVSGSLDDPKFSVWGIILKILVNLIAKAATSPFALLGAIFGGGEELSYIEFDYGMSLVTEPNQKKINTLIKALSDRPALKLDIEGHVDLERDREGLKQLFFQRKLKAEKLKEVAKKGQPVVPVDEVKIEPPEYPQYLKLAYKEEKFPKPRNILGMAKDIPVPDMEKLMLTHIEIKESDLRSLANQRGMSVKDAISKSGKVEPERIFILEPKSLSAEKKEKLKDSRVELKLK
jgi:flagellar motor protein MotB